MRGEMMGVTWILCVVLCGLCGSACASGDTHSLYYLYTIQSKSSSEGGYEFSAETLLDDEEIDSYSSISTNTGGIRTPKQEWLRKMKEREWIEGTDKLKYDGQELNQVLESHMKAFRHRESVLDGHTLQWMAGCEGEIHSDGSVSGLNGVNEYTYDGQTLIS
ncbi:hypothetical protein NFI96_017992 [Prochilodus magdalenae]|nr:hypothetical protein NFI96_017992 [Prochilodus magdalenae]